MTAYFECPGDATVSDTSVQCSVSIQTLDSSQFGSSFTQEDFDQILGALLLVVVTVFIYSQIKKAIEL